MKKIFVSLLVALMLMIPVLGLPATDKVVAESLTFEWEQTEADLADIAGWTLYASDVSGSGYVKVVDIPLTTGTVAAGLTTFQSPANLSIVGVSGATVTKYFVLTSRNAINEQSEYSNEVSQAFVIPYGKPAKPYNLKIKVVTP